jgi:hypothetical protein
MDGMDDIDGDSLRFVERLDLWEILGSVVPKFVADLQRLSKFVADLQRLSCLPHPLYS